MQLHRSAAFAMRLGIVRFELKNKRRPRGRRFVNTSVRKNPLFGLLPILLDARGAQTGKSMLVDGRLPGEEFLDCQCVTGAGFFEGE